jgi:hypothetical protein
MIEDCSFVKYLIQVLEIVASSKPKIFSEVDKFGGGTETIEWATNNFRFGVDLYYGLSIEPQIGKSFWYLKSTPEFGSIDASGNINLEDLKELRKIEWLESK